MKKLILLTSFLFFFSSLHICAGTTGSNAETPDNSTLINQNDEIALFLSGLPCTGEKFKNLQASQSWKEFAGFFKTNWNRVEKYRFSKMRKWAKDELADSISETKLLFNAFGGPDFITPYIFYPDAQMHILFGLEPVGNLPELEKLSALQLKSYLEDIKAAHSDFFGKSYYISKHMLTQLGTDKADGVLPLILISLKKVNCTIGEIKRVSISSNGSLIETPYTVIKKLIKRPYGIKITFTSPDSTGEKTIYYYSFNAENKSFCPGSPMYNYLKKMGTITSFMKCASYLLHYKTYSYMKDLIMEKSSFILEDDTGIPYKFFNKKNWDVQLYGIYTDPVSDFAGVGQPDLQKAFQDKKKVKKFPFHLGYHWSQSLDAWLYIKKNEGRK